MVFQTSKLLDFTLTPLPEAGYFENSLRKYLHKMDEKLDSSGYCDMEMFDFHSAASIMMASQVSWNVFIWHN